jgi:predicted Holliday junction resolvase-like endonuclease
MEESFDDSPYDTSGYNDECPHIKEVSSYELLHFNCLVQLLNVHIHFRIQKLEKKLVLVEKELQQVRKDNQAFAQYINAKRKKAEEAWKKEEEAWKKEEEDQSSKDVRTWRK